MTSPFAAAQTIIINTPGFQQTATFTPAHPLEPDAFYIEAFSDSFAEDPLFQSINGVFVRTPMMEDVAPGQGTTVVYFFVRWADIIPTPQTGDNIQIKGSSYNIENVEVDRVGGAVLKLGRYV